MFFTRQEILREKIVRVLAEHPRLTVAEITDRVSSRFEKYSAPATYKELRSLIQDGVILRNENRHMLQMSWVYLLEDLARRMTQNYQIHSKLSILMPEDKTKAKWKFRTLYQLNDWWTQLIYMIAMAEPVRHALSWNPHPVFFLINPEVGKSMTKWAGAKKFPVYKICGSDHMLDHVFDRFWEEVGYHVSYAKSPYTGENNSYFNVLNDYIISVKLDQKTTADIQRAFRYPAKDLGAAISDLITLSHGTASASVTLERDALKASKYRKVFSRFFGQQID